MFASGLVGHMHWCLLHRADLLTRRMVRAHTAKQHRRSCQPLKGNGGHDQPSEQGAKTRHVFGILLRLGWFVIQTCTNAHTAYGLTQNSRRASTQPSSPPT